MGIPELDEFEDKAKWQAVVYMVMNFHKVQENC
jgi:hypothetical protein